MAAFERTLIVSQSTPSATRTIYFAPPPQPPLLKNFVAWGSITWIDPRAGAFDVNNAIGFDIPVIFDENVAPQPTEAIFTGGALGPLHDGENLRKASIVGVGTGIVCRLRVYPKHPGELVCIANCVVITDP
jgi:hypothetical protein